MKEMINIEDRILYYLGNSNYNLKYFPKRIDPVKINQPFSVKQDYRVLSYNQGNGNPYNPYQNSYIVDIDRYKTYTDRDFWLQCNEPYLGQPFPVLVKFRSLDQKSTGVLANLNSYKHWKLCGLINQIDIPWNEKKNKVIWRGATTGLDYYGEDGRKGPFWEYRKNKYKRDQFVKDYHNKFDIGFSYIVESAQGLDKFVKRPMPIQELLKNKYIVSIDGNDKSSSINWILTSNSIPVMPKPRFHSWLCEPWLKPNIHYVEVKQDFSDFEEKIEWCNNHDKECQQIAENGKNFILDNFSSEIKLDHFQEIEKQLISRVTSVIYLLDLLRRK